MRRVLAVVAVLAGSVMFATRADAGGGCYGAPTGSGSGATVELVMNCMSPRVLRAAEGAGAITFVNRDEASHNLFGDGWSVDLLAPGASVTRQFPTGTHVYACTLHAGMVGAVVVGDGVGSARDQATPVRAVSVVPDDTEDESSSAWVFAGLAGLVLGAAATVGLRRLRVAVAKVPS